MKNYEIKLDFSTEQKIIIKLYRNIKNISELQQKILSGELQCCAVKATLIVDPFQIVVAANKSVINNKQSKLVTKSIYSEILFNLSISKNVSKSLPQFGIDNKCTNIFVTVICDIDKNGDEIFRQIDGDETDLNELDHIVDVNDVKKAYNINAIEEQNCKLLDIIVDKIVTKHF